MSTSIQDEQTYNQSDERQALLKKVLWDVYDMAEFLGLSVHCIRRVVHAPPVGFPSALFLGGKWIWRAVEVQRWAEGEYIQPYTPPPSAAPQALTMRGRGRPRRTIEVLASS